MGLSSELISQFVKVTNDSKSKPKETTVYGTVKSINNGFFVQLDGSSLLTPVIATTSIKNDDRVTVMIKNHSAIVTGNLSSPSASNEELIDLAGDLGILGDDFNDLNNSLTNIDSNFSLLVKTVSEINDDLTETGMQVVELQKETDSINGTLADIVDLTSGIEKTNSGVYKINGMEFGTNKLLWNGTMYMHAGQTIELSEPISSQNNGIVLVFCKYENGAAAYYNFSYHFVPKSHVDWNNNAGISFTCNHDPSFDVFSGKYLYISNTMIRGNDLNMQAGTATSGVKFDNSLMVLIRVFGV